MIDRRLVLDLLRKKLGLANAVPSASVSSLLSSSPSLTSTTSLLSSGLIRSSELLSCGCRMIMLTPVRYSSSGAPPPPPPQPNRYNHYETLGVAEDATPQEIKKAFYSLSKRCHPDLHPDDERMAEKFKSLTTAYEVLIDKDKRSAYDIEKNIRRSNQPRWHGYSSQKYYPVAKGQRPQVSYTTADVSRRRGSGKSRRFESNLGDLGDSEKDEWIRQQHKKMKERLEEEDRQFKDEWKQMMGSRSGLTPGEPGFNPDSLTEEERKRWQEFQNKLEERRKEQDAELAFQNQRIAQHPALYYFYNMKYDWVEWTLWPIGLIGGMIYIFYVISKKPAEEQPYKTMEAQFEEEGRLHKKKMAEKRERQRQLEALMLERSLQKKKLAEEKEKREEEKEKEKEEEEEKKNEGSEKQGSQDLVEEENDKEIDKSKNAGPDSNDLSDEGVNAPETAVKQGQPADIPLHQDKNSNFPAQEPLLSNLQPQNSIHAPVAQPQR